MTHVSLFSGIGGIDLAAHWAGFKTTAVCEIDPLCRKVLARHFPDANQFTDIRNITDGSIESPTLVSAGFPCQPFSIAGSRQGTSDERHLWPEVVRVLGFLKPKWFLGENVRGLLSISEGRIFGSILADLAHLGYRVGWGCFGADEACGAPHRRDRVFIVGYLAHGSEQRGDGCHGQSKCEVSKLGNKSSSMAHSGCVGDQRRRDTGVIPCETCKAQRVKEERERSGNTSDCRISSVAHAKDPNGRRNAVPEQLRRRSPEARRYSGIFPPGPADLEAWSRILRDRPDLAPALTAEEEAELSVCRVDDGISRRMALKMLGNAVVPQQVYPVLQAIADHIQGEAA